MHVAFVILALLTIGSAIAAVSLRNLVHCALFLVAAFAGLAGFYLQLSAQFVGLAQILVYVGAVAILIVFAILLTRSGGVENQPIFSISWKTGVAVAVMTFGAIAYAVMENAQIRNAAGPGSSEITVRQLGNALMTVYVLPLEAIALLLTAATIGAVLIAMEEKE